METFNEKVFRELSKESQEKVEQIYIIASLMQDYKVSVLTAEEFDKLYAKSVDELMSLAGTLHLKFQAEMLKAQFSDILKNGRL
jgi:hypothetical protein